MSKLGESFKINSKYFAAEHARARFRAPQATVLHTMATRDACLTSVSKDTKAFVIIHEI